VHLKADKMGSLI